MKIMLIDVNYRINSTGKIMYDLHSGFNKLGHEVIVSYGRGPNFNDANVVKHSLKLEVYFHALRTRILGYVGQGSEFATNKIIKQIKQFNPDIINIHTLHGYHLHIYKLLRYIKRTNRNLVLTLHDTTTFTGKCGHTFECEKWLTECNKCPQKKEYPKVLFFDRTKKEFGIKKEIFSDFSRLRIISVSNWLAEQARKSVILRNNHIDVVYNGLDEDVFRYRYKQSLRDSIASDTEKIVLHVTPNFDDPLKGGKYVIKFAEKVKSAKIIIIGNKEHIPNLPKNIIQIGRTENQIQLAEYYSIADFLLLTSSKETFSMVTAEALSCGTRVIGFEAGAPSEIAPDGYGFFGKYGDIDGLVELYEDLVSNKVSSFSRSECSEYAKNTFTRSKMVKEYLGVYNLLLNNKALVRNIENGK